MTSWGEFRAAEPEFAGLAERILGRGVALVIATLRADGSPRVSGLEIVLDGGELAFGSMPGSRKGADLRRDPRFALHAAPADQSGGAMGDGDLKVSGRAVWTGPLAGSIPGDGFQAELGEVVWTGVNEARNRLVVRWWSPGSGLRSVERE
ncbi:pyridoxamine 5'-phosphate oxidase family protein [Pseudonocardia sp. HH130630-07]|uniref:pyridoxamine 5'-phosphate oxidase family protein n=1 Tax=Pseudonocardia sp. HH130630-07 TaxID=1690815 RepID=UPI000814FE57|nr:pyridoxamine 5'-phosphate oxidase family protein [Pseudonocardia sp. HH130630-07]ANY06052.1 pyridoxamine 5-phosphate oxidase [Pseudonocardia sp. HH130630-07]